MEYNKLDLSLLLETTKCGNFDQDHLMPILYNILCSANFIHSFGLVHGNFNPNNIKLNESCFVTIS